ncbi:MAG: prepilin-type N-terminal cleavage/methylation domain-containing protein [Candidatus Paceibacterota bacterium]
MKASNRAFTLLELLVVIAIIGILSSIVLASLNSARMRSRDSVRRSDMHQIQTALQLYWLQNNGTYPVISGQAKASELAPALVPTYIASIPTDPVNTPVYMYSYYTVSPYNAYTLLVNYEGDAPVSTCRIDINGGYTPWNYYPVCQ